MKNSYSVYCSRPVSVQEEAPPPFNIVNMRYVVLLVAVAAFLTAASRLAAAIFGLAEINAAVAASADVAAEDEDELPLRAASNGLVFALLRSVPAAVGLVGGFGN